MKNYYPEKPIVEYVKTTVEMALVIAHIKRAAASPEVKRMAYIIFRNEGANGRKGICNNYCGFQADGARWAAIHDDKIYGIVEKKENGTGKVRLFLAFKDFGGCLDMLIERVQGRGLFVGGTTKKVWEANIKDATMLARAYQKEWVKGSAAAEPSPVELANFLSMYNQAKSLFV